MTDPSELQDKQQESHEHTENIRAASQLPASTTHPETVKELSDPDWAEGENTDKSWLKDAAGTWLHRDQVFGIRSSRDQWERHWLNRNKATKKIMSHPRPESRTEDPRVNRFISRMRGDQKTPLTQEQREDLRSKAEQKTDRESRSLAGRFLQNMTENVVMSKRENESRSDTDSLWSKIRG